MLPRAYVPEATRAGEVVPLPAEEAAHLRRVLRLAAGAALEIFNGRGQRFEARFEPVGRSGGRVSVEADRPAVATPRLRVALAVAVLGGERMDTVIRDATMLGVDRIQPVLARHSGAGRRDFVRGTRPERWHRVTVSAAKQCGRDQLPALAAPLPTGEVVEAVRTGGLPQPALLMVEPAAGTVSAWPAAPREAPEAVTVIVGPEGGWAREELSPLLEVCHPLTLGGLTLRAEVAPLVAVSAVRTRWDGW